MTKGGRRRAMLAVAIGVVTLGVGALAAFGLPGRGDSAPPQQDMPIDRTTRSAVIDGVVAKLDAFYVFPDKGHAVGRRLQARAAAGDFDRVKSAQALAEALTRTLQEDAGDRHLEVRYFEKPLSAATGDGRPAEEEAAELRHERRLNYGMAGFERLHGNVGYLDLHAFGRPTALADARYAAAMGLLADTDALIIDLRRCGGGDPESVMRFASRFFDRPAHLNDVYWRDENRIEARWTDPQVAGKRYGETRKVYLLTSEDTFSGCEDFAYALKNAGRATLVGETTGGGAHAGAAHRIDPHFMVFVPSGRPINPVTHTDWEGVGVTPDIAVPAKRAQEVAYIAALKALIANETDTDWKAALQQQLEEEE